MTPETALRPIGAQQLRITITHLEMREPPSRPQTLLPSGITIQRAQQPSVNFYRHLYNTVGAPWLWYERRLMEDAALRALIQHPRVEIFVLYVKGEVAGYAECDCRQAPDLELAYFGLLPEFIGRGLGTKFLHWVIATAWSYEPQKFWLHTCTLDHPGALALYQRAGFVIFQQEEKLIDDPRALGLIPHSN